eukprot:m.255203 g.255203  ORF g.255203 m.255203 type:complete len:230 (-) comp26547_c1_seq3:2247-2936(-)
MPSEMGPVALTLPRLSVPVDDLSCPICHKVFTAKRNMKRHMLSHDANAKKYTCDYKGCSSAFLRKDDYNDHLKTHSGDQMLQCPHCPKTFSRAGDLNLHTRRHTNNRPFTCDLCPKAFVRKCDLAGHRRRKHHGQAPPPNQVGQPPTPPPLQLSEANGVRADEVLPPLETCHDLGLFASTALAKKELCPWSDCACGLACECKSACSCGSAPKSDAEWAAVLESLLQDLP